MRPSRARTERTLPHFGEASEASVPHGRTGALDDVRPGSVGVDVVPCEAAYAKACHPEDGSHPEDGKEKAPKPRRRGCKPAATS